MKLLVLSACIGLAHAASHSRPSVQYPCFDISEDFTNPVPVAVDCLASNVKRQTGDDTEQDPEAEDDPDPTDTAYQAGTANPEPTITSIAPIPTGVKGIPNAFTFDINCTIIENRTRADFCEKATTAFINAGQIISNVFDITVPIKVNATIKPFCGNNACDAGIVDKFDNQLGNAKATREIPLLDDDGVIRFYPQALVKQFGREIQGYQYADSDITANFNSLIPTAYFGGDPLNSTQVVTAADFESTAMHELLHGMGFISGYLNDTTLDDRLWLVPINLAQTNKSEVTIIGLRECAFDRFVNRVDGNSPQSLSAAIKNLTGALFADGPITLPVNASENVDLHTIRDFYHQIINKTPAAASLNEIFSGVATKRNSLAFVPTTKNQVYLETSLNPFQQGSSICHVDFDSYNTTQNFFMVYQDVPGSLEYSVAKYNNLTTNNDDLTSIKWLEANVNLDLAFGTGIRDIMQSIGWTLRTTDYTGPTSTSTTSGPRPTASDTSSAATTGVSFFAGLAVALICFLSA